MVEDGEFNLRVLQLVEAVQAGSRSLTTSMILGIGEKLSNTHELTWLFSSIAFVVAIIHTSTSFLLLRGDRFGCPSERDNRLLLCPCPPCALLLYYCIA